MVRQTGVKRHLRRLQNMRGIELVNEMDKQVFYFAGRIRAEAQHLITAGSISGAGHVPSKPGEPLNEDTGQLRQGIAERKTGPMMAVVESTAPYAVVLEVGGSKVAPRPYMSPAAISEAHDFVRGVAGGVNLVIRRS